MTIINQIVSLILLNMCLLFAGHYYAGFMQQQREYYYLQLGYLFLWQGKSAIEDHWQEQVYNKLPEASGTKENNIITINYKSSWQDEPIVLTETF